MKIHFGFSRLANQLGFIQEDLAPTQVNSRIPSQGMTPTVVNILIFRISVYESKLQPSD